MKNSKKFMNEFLMMPFKTKFAAHFGSIYSLLIAVCASYSFESEMCLEQALTIHAVMQKHMCPDYLLDAHPAGTESAGCSLFCKGRFTTKNELYGDLHCIKFDISFILKKNRSTKLQDLPCKIPKCILEFIEFECSNETLRMKEHSFCTAPAIPVVVSLSCAVVGCFLGICGFLIAKRIRSHYPRLDSSAVFYQPQYETRGESSASQILTIPNTTESEYADIEDSIKMIAKAIQVPSYKEDSSSESRSRENIYHHLNLEHSPKDAQSVLLSIQNSYTEDNKSSKNGSPSIKSDVINAENLSSQSNSSKLSPSGSEGSNKYYALEQDYLVPLHVPNKDIC